MPLAKSNEEKEALRKACQEFESQASELQKRLVERKEVEMKDTSWLQLWWNTLGYLQVSYQCNIGVHTPKYLIDFINVP